MPLKTIQLLVSLLFLFMLVIGCEETPVEQYTSVLMSSKTKADAAADAATLSAVEATINSYRAMHDKNPSDLREISSMMGTELDPDKYDYEPVSGKVRLRSGH